MSNDDTLRAIYNAFEPNVPATVRYYSDCSEARGESNFAKKIIRKLYRAKDEKLRYLFTGQAGCGKSSELIKLAHKLENETTFFPIYIDFENYLDRYDTVLEDIFLAVYYEIINRFKEKFAIQVNENFFSRIKEITGFYSNLLAEDENTSLFDVSRLKVQKLRQNPNLREQIRQKIENRGNYLIFHDLNYLIQELELKLSQQTEFSRIVIIADSLEKIRKFENAEGEFEAQKKLFIDNFEPLTKITANIIYTVPLSLYRSSYGIQLRQIYDKTIFNLPIIKTHKRGEFNVPSEVGIKELIKIIDRRLIYAGISLEEVFEQDALDHLIKYCGGHIRTLFWFIREASISVDELPIDLRAARESVKGEVRRFAASVKEREWGKLAVLEKSVDQQIDSDDFDFLMMLNSLTVLEYVNDEDNEDDKEHWYAINPAVRNTIKFKSALEVVSNTIEFRSPLSAHEFSPHSSPFKPVIKENQLLEKESPILEKESPTSVFLSHATKDKPFVRDLAQKLEQSGVNIWLDERELDIGDSLTQKIALAIDKMDYFAIVLSNNSVNSVWVQKELQDALSKELDQKRIVVLPLLLEEVAIPPFLKDKLYADFTSKDKFEESFQRLLKAMLKKNRPLM